MYIKPGPLKNGSNRYLTTSEGIGKDIDLDVELCILEPGQKAVWEEADKETALLLFEGTLDWTAEGKTVRASRKNPFDEAACCLHVCRGVKAEVAAVTHCEIYVQKTHNDRVFPAVFYRQEDVQVQKAGAKGELDGTMRRNIQTLFDYDNAPYSNMVLGEVMNFPGRWSSYPPHHHPQPEVYFYRFDKPQGFGCGFANGELIETGHNGLLVITSQFHSQVAAPGYAMCYVWGIRHLDGDPWIKTRIDDEEHKWMLAPDPEIWKEK